MELRARITHSLKEYKINYLQLETRVFASLWQAVIRIDATPADSIGLRCSIKTNILNNLAGNSE